MQSSFSVQDLRTSSVFLAHDDSLLCASREKDSLKGLLSMHKIVEEAVKPQLWHQTSQYKSIDKVAVKPLQLGDIVRKRSMSELLQVHADKDDNQRMRNNVESLLSSGGGHTFSYAGDNCATMFTGGGADLRTGLGAGLGVCWTSRQMAKLMDWRNPQEPMGSEVSRVRAFINIGKKVITELCLPFLTVSAIVETVVYKVLEARATLRYLIIKYTQEVPPNTSQNTLETPPQEVSKASSISTLNSPEFTTLWVISSLWKNITQQKLASKEFEARGLLFNGFFK